MNSPPSVTSQLVDSCASPTGLGRVERVREQAVVPIELWDFMVGDSLLGERLYEPGFPAVLGAALEALHSGTGGTRSHGPLPPALQGFEAVLLTGGRAQEPGLQTLAGSSSPIYFGSDGVFTSTAGGFHLLKMRGLSGWVLDLGQYQLKLAAPERRWLFPRDSTRLRAAGEVPAAQLPAQRRRLAEFVALKMDMAMAASGCRPSALVAALPSRLAPDGTPVGSNYAGLRGYRELFPDALAMLGLFDIPVLVLNDAELAGFAALAEPRLAGFGKILVFTLGFGIGATLVSRPACPWVNNSAPK